MYMYVNQLVMMVDIPYDKMMHALSLCGIGVLLCHNSLNKATTKLPHTMDGTLVLSLRCRNAGADLVFISFGRIRDYLVYVHRL